MWLPETAVDNETLDVLARLGIQFTILAPWQVSHPASIWASHTGWHFRESGGSMCFSTRAS